MYYRITTLLVTGLTFVLSIGLSSAQAGTTPIHVPEPTTMSLFGLGIGGAFIAKKLLGR